jgi:hypothetical protein
MTPGDLVIARGDAEKSIRIAREAVAIAEPTDFLFHQSFVLEGLGEVLHVAGLPEEADQAAWDPGARARYRQHELFRASPA